MPRQRSAKTENRTLRFELTIERRRAAEWERQAREFKVQATRVAAELSEWKSRFDALLGIVGAKPEGGKGA